MSENRVRDLIDELKCDQHKLERYAEVDENYDMSQSNAQAFRTLYTNADANSIDIIKTYKGKSKPYTYCRFSENNNNTKGPLTAVPVVSMSVLPNCPCFYR